MKIKQSTITLLIFTGIILLAFSILSLPTTASNISLDAYKIISSKPDNQVKSSITVTNNSDEPVTVQVWVEDWKTITKNGKLKKIALGSAGQLDRSLAPFLTIKSSRHFTIKPHSDNELIFTTDAPTKGSYWTAIAFAITPENSENTKLAFYSKVIRYSKDNENLKPTINFVSKLHNSNVDVTVDNEGSVAFFAPAKLTIYNELLLTNNIEEREATIATTTTGEEAITTLAPFYALPGQSYTATVKLPQIPPGVYTLKVKMLMSKGDYTPVALREFKIG